MRRAHLLGLAMLVVGAAVLGSGLWTLDTTVQAAGETTVTIPGDYYAPAAVMVDVGQSVTWVNKDSDKHTAVTVMGAPEAFSLPAYPGKSVSFKFTKPGVYAYYCQEHATFDPKLRRSVARKESDRYPIAMEGVIVVKGPGFTGAPTATINVSGGNYAPDIAVIAAGGKVTWTNADTAEHSVAFPPGAGEATKLSLPAGKSQTATFAKPGIYLFYDERSATFNSKLGLAAAKTGTATFPVSMQGYVIVL
jgi:plastocyanin